MTMATVATATARTAALRAYRAPLRRPDFRWLVAGQMLSTFGNMMFTVALPFIVLDRADAGDLSLTIAVLGVARIAGTPLGGLLTDRWRPRRVMLIADIARSAVLFGFIAIGLSTGTGLSPVLVMVALLGVLDGIFVPAYWTMMPSVLPDTELAVGNAVGESLMILAVMVGPLAGGLAMATLPPATVLGANAATFVVSALTLVRVRGLPVVERPAGPDPHRGEFRAFLRRSRLFVVMLVMTGLLTLTTAGIVSVALPVFADRMFADGARAFGFLLSAQGAGLLVGTLAGGLSATRSRRGYLAVALLAGQGVALAAIATVTGLIPLMMLMALFGLSGGLLAVVVLTLLQQISPAPIRGRVMAAFTSVTIGCYPISAVLIGLAVTGSGAGAAFMVGAAGAVAVALVALSQRAVREA